jgi:hypothetical protein
MTAVLALVVAELWLTGGARQLPGGLTELPLGQGAEAHVKARPGGPGTRLLALSACGLRQRRAGRCADPVGQASSEPERCRLTGADDPEGLLRQPC